MWYLGDDGESVACVTWHKQALFEAWILIVRSFKGPSIPPVDDEVADIGKCTLAAMQRHNETTVKHNRLLHAKRHILFPSVRGAQGWCCPHYQELVFVH